MRLVTVPRILHCMLFLLYANEAIAYTGLISDGFQCRIQDLEKGGFHNWASVSEPHTCDFNATFSLYICDRHCTSKIAINISIFHLGSYTRRAQLPRRRAVGPTHFRSHCPLGPSCELTCSLCSSGILLQV